METVVYAALLTVGVFIAVSAGIMLATGLMSMPKDGQLQPKFSVNAQRSAVIACAFLVPVLQKLLDPHLNEQDQINSLFVSMIVLLGIWALFLSRHVERSPNHK